MLLYFKFFLILLVSIILISCKKDTLSTSDNHPSQLPNYQQEQDKNTDITGINIANFINDKNCDQIIEHKFQIAQTDLLICYNYNYKSAKYVNYSLDADLVNEVNLEDRLSFYTEKTVPKEFQSTYDDYTYSGYDRGHLAPDADFDYDIKDLKITYTMANIIPQDPNINRYFWSKLERYERYVTTKLKFLNIIIGIEFDQNPTRIGKNKIAVPKAFWKILWNDKEDYKKCFYYNNFVLGDADKDKLRDHEVDCNTLFI